MTEEKPPPLGAGVNVSLSDLTTGRLIERWTETVGLGRVRAPLPCHEAQTVTIDPGTLWEGSVAVCRACSRTFDLVLEADSDGGFWAKFTVAYRPYVLSRAKPKDR